MKRLIYSGLFFLACISTISCKKNTAEQPVDTSFEVIYMISPAINGVVSISYTDQTGATIQTQDPTQFPNGVKKIKVSGKPFNAKMSVNIVNTANAPANATLSISVDAEVKKIQPISAPANATFTGTVEYTVQ